MQRKAKEQEERVMEQERINEGLKELNREEKENFARYDFVFFIIVYYLKKGRFLTRKEDNVPLFMHY